MILVHSGSRGLGESVLRTHVDQHAGNGVEADGSFHNVHTPGYDFNDDILALGAAYWVKLVQTELAMG